MAVLAPNQSNGLAKGLTAAKVELVLSGGLSIVAAAAAAAAAEPHKKL